MRYIRIALIPLSLLCLWFVSSSLGWINTLLVPTPQAVARSFFSMLSTGELAGHALTSFSRVMAGFFMSATLALLLAFWFSHSSKARESGEVMLETIRVIPPLALIPFLILWFGIGETPKIVIVVLASFFPVYLSSLNAFQNTSKEFREVAAMYRLTKKEVFCHVTLPETLPQVVTGLRLGFGYAWRALVGAELLGATAGLGYLIEDASELSQPDRIVVGIFTIAFLGLLVDSLFLRLSARLTPWTRSEGEGA